MPRLIPTSDSETPALLALRRTLWQLAFLGIVAAAVLARAVPQSGAIALWCLLVPLSALAAHYRQALLGRLRMRRTAGVAYAPLRPQRQRPQARRARGDAAASRPRRPSRPRLPYAGPLAR